MKAKKLNWGRRIVFSVMTLLLTTTAIFVGGEALVRLIVPEETFWVISNIYRPSENPGVLYTYRPNYDGIAFSVPLKTNSLGFRGPEWAQEKRPGVFRVALIGDSHAFGYGVTYERSVGEVLTAMLKQPDGAAAEVLNFAVNGYNSRQQQAVLEHIASGFAPDLVILMPSSNDHDPPLQADHEGWLHWDGRSSNTDSRMKDSFWEAVLGNSTRRLPKSRLSFYLKLVHLQMKHARNDRIERAHPTGNIAGTHWMSPVPAGAVSDRLAATVYQPMVAMLTRLRSDGIPVILAPLAEFRDYRQMFQILQHEHNVPVVEMFSLFPEAHSWKELQDQFSLGWDDHLGEAAHRRFAEAIAKEIEARGYLLEAVGEHRVR